MAFYKIVLIAHDYSCGGVEEKLKNMERRGTIRNYAKKKLKYRPSMTVIRKRMKRVSKHSTLNHLAKLLPRERLMQKTNKIASYRFPDKNYNGVNRNM